MPDITMCSGAQCQKKFSCYRFTASGYSSGYSVLTPNGARQSYFAEAPGDGVTCEHFDNNMRFAVLTTSDIQSPATIMPKGSKVVSKTLGGAEVATWGVLEKALGRGFHVFVVTSRLKLGVHDEWWIKLVKKENVIQTRHEPDHGCANDPLTMKDWRTFIREKLSLEPNLEVTTWMELLESLKKRGIRTGRDFR